MVLINIIVLIFDDYLRNEGRHSSTEETIENCKLLDLILITYMLIKLSFYIKNSSVK